MKRFLGLLLFSVGLIHYSFAYGTSDEAGERLALVKTLGEIELTYDPFIFSAISEVYRRRAEYTLPDFYRELGRNAWEGVSTVRKYKLDGGGFHEGRFSDAQLDEWFRYGTLNEIVFALTGVGSSPALSVVGESTDEEYVNHEQNAARMLYLICIKNKGLNREWEGWLKKALLQVAIRVIPFEPAPFSRGSTPQNYPQFEVSQLGEKFKVPLDMSRVKDFSVEPFKGIEGKIVELKEALAQDRDLLKLARFFHKQKLVVEKFDKVRGRFSSFTQEQKNAFNKASNLETVTLNALQYYLFEYIQSAIWERSVSIKGDRIYQSIMKGHFLSEPEERETPIGGGAGAASAP